MDFADHRGIRRHLQEFNDTRLTESLGFTLDKLAESRLTVSGLTPKLIRWLDCLPDSIKKTLARWGLMLFHYIFIYIQQYKTTPP